MEFFLQEVFPWLQNIARISFVLPLAIGLLAMNKRSSLMYKLLLLYTGLVALVEIVGFTVVYLGTDNNLWVMHLYTPLEFLLISLIYYYSYSSKLLKMAVKIVAVLFTLISGYLLLWGQDITLINSYSRTLAAFLLITMALVYLYQTAHDLKFTYLDRDPAFVFSCGILLYQAGTSMAFAQFNDALAESLEAAKVCVAVLLILNIFHRLMLALALTRAAKVSKPKLASALPNKSAQKA